MSFPCAPEVPAITAPAVHNLFAEQRCITDHFFDHLDDKTVSQFFNACLECTGTIIFSGVGKSGIVCQKTAQTLVSIGVQADYLSPQDSMHGDLGRVQKGDILVCVSKSGETDELIQMVPFARAKGAMLVSVTCIKDSKLEKACHLGIHLPLLRELCPFSLAPVTSCALQMLFGDTLVVALMHARKLTKEEYAANHPAGRIGRRLLLQVADIMGSKETIPLVSPESSMVDALMAMTNTRCGCAVVASPVGDLLGILTDGDVRRTLLHKGADVLLEPVGDVMTSNPKFCFQDQKAFFAVETMQGSSISALPVLDGHNKVVGLVTLSSLIALGL